MDGKVKNSISGSRILVIGGAGFIGSHLVEQLILEDIEQIIIYDNLSRGKIQNISFIENYGFNNDKIKVVIGDVRDLDVLDNVMKGIDYVFHLAAMWLLHCKDYPRTAFKVNIEGTFNVLELCVKNNIKKLVFSSSASVYGDAVYSPMDEAHPFNNKNFYGATKIAGEAMATAFYERYGLKIIGLRYANVYGPKQNEDAVYTGVIPTFLRKIETGEDIEIHGDGSQAYDFIYVEDAANANICAVKSNIDFGFYNVGTGVKTTIKQLVDILIKLTNSKIGIKYKPYDQNDLRQLVKDRVLDPNKAYTDLGFKYRYTLEEGLKKLIEWRKKNFFVR